MLWKTETSTNLYRKYRAKTNMSNNILTASLSNNFLESVTVTKHETIVIHTCVDAMDGQRKQRSLHDNFTSHSKKTKSNEKESEQGKRESRSLSNIITRTKLTEAFYVTNKSHLNTMANYCRPLHTFKRPFRGLEKEVFIKIYFTLLKLLRPFHSKVIKGRKILLFNLI